MKGMSSIQIALEQLIEEKSRRDQVSFTSSQLAAALCMPRSIITRLLHPNPLKRVTNPRIDTLLKIVDFFRADGFHISVDDLLGTKAKAIDVQQQFVAADLQQNKIPLFSFEAALIQSIGNIEIKLNTKSKNIFALVDDEDRLPMFKKGSIFVVDRELEPEDDTLVAVKFPREKKIQIKKFHIQGHKRILTAFDGKEKPIVLLPTLQYEIVGVVIQVNAKT